MSLYSFQFESVWANSPVLPPFFQDGITWHIGHKNPHLRRIKELIFKGAATSPQESLLDVGNGSNGLVAGRCPYTSRNVKDVRFFNTNVPHHVHGCFKAADTIDRIKGLWYGIVIRDDNIDRIIIVFETISSDLFSKHSSCVVSRKSARIS